MLFEQKGTLLFLLLVAVTFSLALWFWSDSPLLGVVAFGVFLLTIGRAFVPISFEINTDGIVSGTFGRKKFIAWEEIRSYRVQPTGMMIFPHTDRYPLDLFRSFFLPIPESLREEVQLRFAFFVDHLTE